MIGTLGSPPHWKKLPSGQHPSATVKIVDECPTYAPNQMWCAGTDKKPNKYGAFVHFDISQSSVPGSFFPDINVGAWLANYTEVSCEKWPGWNKPGTKGLAVPDSGCCPSNPFKDGNICKLEFWQKCGCGYMGAPG